ncbi:hypothetical protein Q5752_001529 [Cryptotrichosporon argae]
MLPFLTLNALSSLFLRALSLLVLSIPHALPSPAHYAPLALYILYLVSALLTPARVESTTVVSELKVPSPTYAQVASAPPAPDAAVPAAQSKNQKRKQRKLNLTQARLEPVAVEHHVERLDRGGIIDLLTGNVTASTVKNVVSLLLNTLLLLATLDHVVTPKLLDVHDLEYARVTALSPTAASVSLRLPPHAPLQTAEGTISYRPLFADQQWEESTFTLRGEDDWTAEPKLSGLSPDVQYEYRLKVQGAEYPERSFNFTTFPDPSLARRSGSRFRFFHTGPAVPRPQAYAPLAAVESILPSFPALTPHPTVHGVGHHLKEARLRQPAWATLAHWLADVRERKAWAQVAFGLSGVRLGKVLDTEGRNVRQFLDSTDVRRVYETAPLLPSTPYSPSGPILEPAALVYPETSFGYADTAYFRLRNPFQEHGETEAQDWETDLTELGRWLAKVNATAVFKFVISPVTLTPFFGGSDLHKEWRTQVLDLLAFVPNVIVLSDLPHAFLASRLRHTVTEIASPSFEPTASETWAKLFGAAPVVPDRSLAVTEPVAMPAEVDGRPVEQVEFVAVDDVLRYIPALGKARWTAFEVDTTDTPPRVIVTPYTDGHAIYRLEIHGRRLAPATKAVGSVAQSLGSLLKRLGLVSARWF